MDGTMGRVVIRPLRVEETPLPEDFLYEAIWQPDPAPTCAAGQSGRKTLPPSRVPDCRGTRRGADHALRTAVRTERFSFLSDSGGIFGAEAARSAEPLFLKK